MVYQDDQMAIKPITPSAYRLGPLPIAAPMSLIAALSLHKPTHDRLGDGRVPTRRRIAQIEENDTRSSCSRHEHGELCGQVTVAKRVVDPDQGNLGRRKAERRQFGVGLFSERKARFDGAILSLCDHNRVLSVRAGESDAHRESGRGG